MRRVVFGFVAGFVLVLLGYWLGTMRTEEPELLLVGTEPEGADLIERHALLVEPTTTTTMAPVPPPPPPSLPVPVPEPAIARPAKPVPAPPTEPEPVAEPEAPTSVAGSGSCGGDLPPCSVMQCESGGDIRAENPTSSVSGKWQFIDGTWNGYGGYARASDAPEAVQDAKARELYAGGAGAGHWEQCTR